MLDFFYRFRSIEKLLGDEFQELEKQEIYFSPFNGLNDPMEGFQDIFWKGDSIVWKNLLKHYLLCLQLSCTAWLVSGDQACIIKNQIPVFWKISDLSESGKKQYEDICSQFFKHEVIQKLPESFASRKNPIRNSALLLYLKSLHTYAVTTVLAIFEKDGLLGEQKNQLSSLKSDTFSFLESLIRLHDSSAEISEVFNEIHSHILLQQDLLYSNALQTTSTMQVSNQNKAFILFDFPAKYVKQLERLVYPESYVACFMSECTNASMWGHYGDSHKGVCLKFKANNVQGYPALDLNCCVGSGSNKTESRLIHEVRSHRFYKVNYKNKYPEIDFFRSLGRLNFPTLEESWYIDEDKNISRCAEDIFKDEKKWRQKYWDTHKKGIITKLKDWSYEKEYRLILNDPSLINLKYNFSSLDGIIFGINTPQEDKLQIMRIIEEKCKKESRQEEFKFYQSFYSRRSRKIEYAALNLIRYK